ncbi:calcium:proton antiporter [Glutamicibacter sp. MNS18]|uniref:calcium:proton antiporter n=1 Tax=Glutamicibacter sp. MNS18 TaxID=2989817 RepID=UPI0022367C9F|nr:calcium:proton antiporter [Glutamicibacter sp. MNS18]MCW4466422.1 calcium:proton antiporter [Glutamicibacter sp. MNS18]
MNTTLTRSIITPTAVIRLALGWGTFLLLALSGSLLEPPLPGWLLLTALLVIIAVILLCAFGVVHEAEQLARRMGDPYGSLVLTLSIVMIEVILISAVMLGPGEHATIARDSVMAVSMIILNLVIGISLLAGGMKHGAMAPNRTGTSAYLVMLLVLLSLAFALPGFIGAQGTFTAGQRWPLVVLTLGLYAFFLFRQMGAQAGDFTEVQPVRPMNREDAGGSGGPTPIKRILAEHRKEIGLRLGLLVITVLPIVLLSHDMASLLDDGLDRVGAPVALSGILIAMIVFLPESITSVRAALQGEIQRVSNLCHGALVSTVGLTIPVVLLIGAFTGQSVVLAESPVNLMLLAITLMVSVAGFSAKKVTAMHGAAHLALFAVYGMVVFA